MDFVENALQVECQHKFSFPPPVLQRAHILIAMCSRPPCFATHYHC